MEYRGHKILLSGTETVLWFRRDHGTVSISFPTEEEAIDYIREQEREEHEIKKRNVGIG